MIPDIKYDLHDSLIFGIGIGPRQELKLKISLYDIYYSNHSDIEIRFGGIFNIEACEKYFMEMNKEFEEDSELCFRIESFQYDTKKHSKPNDLYFYLKVEYMDDIRVHCTKYNIKDIESSW